MAEKKVIIINVETNIDELTSKLNETNSRLSQLINAEQRDATETNNLRAQKKALKQEINDLNNAVKSNADQVKTSVTNFVGLGNSINQISRELPAFTMNMNTGFLAISNNLPILFDEINKVKQANVELAATGQPTQSVFKALTSAIFSWGTALSIGVTLLTVYGGKIIDYFTKDNSQRKENNNLISESSKFIAKESTEYIGLVNSLKNTNQGSKERKDLIEKINSQYSTTLKNIDDERLFQEQLNNSIKDYLTYQRARFELKKNEDKITSILQRQSEVQNKLAGAELELQRIQSGGIASGRFTGSYENYNETLKNAEKQVQKYTYSNNELNKQLEMLGYTQLQLIEQTEGKYIPAKDNEKKKEEEIKDLRNEIVDEQIKQIENVNQREQTQLIVNAERRIKEINDSNATEKQKAELIKEIRTNLLNDLDKLDSDYYKKDLEAKKEADKLKIQSENDYLLKIENLQEENYLASLSNKDKDIQLVNDKYFTLEQAAIGNAEQLAIIEEAKNRELDDINKKYTDADVKRRREAIFKIADITVNGIRNIADFYDAYSKDDIKRQRNTFKIRKAANLAQATVDGAKAVLSAFADTPGGPVIKGVAAGLAGAFAALQIATIARTQFDGNSNLSPNAPPPAGGTSVTSPNLSFSMQGGGSSTAQLLNSVLGQPLKAYVVSSDITSAQMLDAKAIKTSVL